MKFLYPTILIFVSLLAFASYQQLSVRNVYTTTPVTTSAFVQLVSATQYPVNNVTVFDSSGQTLELATGASGSEVVQTIIGPGGGDYPFPAAAGSRVSIKALSATANAGEIDLNFY